MPSAVCTGKTGSKTKASAFVLRISALDTFAATCYESSQWGLGWDLDVSAVLRDKCKFRCDSEVPRGEGMDV